MDDLPPYSNEPENSSEMALQQNTSEDCQQCIVDYGHTNTIIRINTSVLSPYQTVYVVIKSTELADLFSVKHPILLNLTTATVTITSDTGSDYMFQSYITLGRYDAAGNFDANANITKYATMLETEELITYNRCYNDDTPMTLAIPENDKLSPAIARILRWRKTDAGIVDRGLFELLEQSDVTMEMYTQRTNQILPNNLFNAMKRNFVLVDNNIVVRIRNGWHRKRVAFNLQIHREPIDKNPISLSQLHAKYKLPPMAEPPTYSYKN